MLQNNYKDIISKAGKQISPAHKNRL